MSIYVYMSMCDTWINLAGLYVSKLPGKENSLINIATSNIRQTLLNKINAKKSILSQDTTGVSENIGCSEVWDKLPTCGTQPTCTLINLLLKKKKIKNVFPAHQPKCTSQDIQNSKKDPDNHLHASHQALGTLFLYIINHLQQSTLISGQLNSDICLL